MDHTLRASHTVWENRAVFEEWTKSEAFRAAHSRAGDNKPLYLDHARAQEPADISDDDALARLFALNQERAKETTLV